MQVTHRTGLLAGVFFFVAFMASAQNPLLILAGNYRLIFENDVVRVEHVLYRPHEKLPVHDHPATPAVYIYLTDSAPVRFTHVEEKAFTATRPAEIAGTFRISPGRLEKHEVENTGDIPSEFLRVELKALPLGFQSGPFHSLKTFGRTRTGVTTELSSPHLKLQRAIAVGLRTTAVKGPGLLVALVDGKIGQREMKSGEVLWLDGKELKQVNAAAGDTADFLLISF